MDADEPTSFQHASILADRDRFEERFEAFLVSLETPVEARRAVAIDTIRRLGAMGRRLRGQGIL